MKLMKCRARMEHMSCQGSRISNRLCYDPFDLHPTNPVILTIRNISGTSWSLEVKRSLRRTLEMWLFLDYEDFLVDIRLKRP